MWRNLRKGVLVVACAWCLTAVGAGDGLRPGQPNELSRSALNITEASAERLGLTFEPAEIEIEGLTRDYAFLWVADLHVIGDDLCEVEEANLDLIASRRDRGFRNPHSGLTSLEVWTQLPEVLNASGADGVLFGGDICDFASLSSIRALKDGMERLTIPFLYARADHDLAPWWLATKNSRRIPELHKSIDGFEPVAALEFPDLLVVAWNNSTSNLTEAGLKRFQELCAKGKPVILVTHVPLASHADAEFDGLCRARDAQGRSLVWGSENYYVPNETTRGLLELVYAEGSPVKAVLAGHLHMAWHGRLTETQSQHLFVPSYLGNIGVVHVKAKK